MATKFSKWKMHSRVKKATLRRQNLHIKGVIERGNKFNQSLEKTACSTSKGNKKSARMSVQFNLGVQLISSNSILCRDG